MYHVSFIRTIEPRTAAIDAFPNLTLHTHACLPTTLPTAVLMPAYFRGFKLSNHVTKWRLLATVIYIRAKTASSAFVYFLRHPSELGPDPNSDGPWT